MTVSAVGAKTLRVFPRRGGGLASFFGGDFASSESGSDIFAGSGIAEDLSVQGSMELFETGPDLFAAAGGHSIVGTLAATEAGTDTLAASGEVTSAPAFSFVDGFERSFVLPYSQNGAAYDSSTRVSIETAAPLIGSASARFVWGPDPDGEDSSAELYMSKRDGGPGIGRQLTEFSLRMTILLPLNWVHRTQSHIPDPSRRSSNNKGIVQLWSGPYGAIASNQFIGFEYVPDAVFGVGGGGSLIAFRWGNDGADGNDYGPPTSAYSSMFSASDIGRRIQYRVYVKLASAPGMTDGIIRVWKYVQGESPTIIFERTDWRYATRGNYIDQLYIWGWANSGFAEQTVIIVDDFNLVEGALIGWGSFS